jgi:uncharacterized protein with FMN-binding domain
MRRIAIAVMSTISGLVLLFSYHTSTGQASSSAGPLGGHGLGSTTANGTGTTTANGSTGSTGSTGASGSGSRTTVTGDPADTRWGTVQVQLTISGGKIVDAQAVQFPNNNHRDQEINSYAVPMLNQQAVQAQSAQIDGVSGATVTSMGYQQSLQSAIDKAHLG